jgi:hypothetical protein
MLRNIFNKKTSDSSSPPSPQTNGTVSSEDQEYLANIQRLEKHKANLEEYSSVLQEDDEV